MGTTTILNIITESYGAGRSVGQSAQVGFPVKVKFSLTENHSPYYITEINGDMTDSYDCYRLLLFENYSYYHKRYL